jgi:hypothetical protein
MINVICHLPSVSLAFSFLAFIVPPGPSKSQEQINPVEFRCADLFNWGLTPVHASANDVLPGDRFTS